jgi:hypothetical protein
MVKKKAELWPGISCTCRDIRISGNESMAKHLIPELFILQKMYV